MERKKIVEIICLAGIVLIGAVITLAIIFDVAIGGDDKKLRERVQDYFTPTADLGYLVEQQLLNNQNEIKRLIARIEKLKAEDVELLRQVLLENGVHLKENEGCDYDIKERRFVFYDINP